MNHVFKTFFTTVYIDKIERENLESKIKKNSYLFLNEKPK